MYGLYKVFGWLSKFLSNIMVVIFVPLSIILCGISWCMFFIEEILTTAGATDVIDGSKEVLGYIKWIGLGLAVFIITLWTIFVLFLIIKKILYKRVANYYITRNKEFRNRDINNYMEKLENYRYRD